MLGTTRPFLSRALDGGSRRSQPPSRAQDGGSRRPQPPSTPQTGRSRRPQPPPPPHDNVRHAGTRAPTHGPVWTVQAQSTSGHGVQQQHQQRQQTQQQRHPQHGLASSTPRASGTVLPVGAPSGGSVQQQQQHSALQPQPQQQLSQQQQPLRQPRDQQLQQQPATQQRILQQPQPMPQQQQPQPPHQQEQHVVGAPPPPQQVQQVVGAPPPPQQVQQVVGAQNEDLIRMALELLRVATAHRYMACSDPEALNACEALCFNNRALLQCLGVSSPGLCASRCHAQ
eukprot:2161150-Amphidinium_carterae.1